MKPQKIVLQTSRLKRLVHAAQKKGEKIVFTNGCFDILHPGHTRYLAEAKELGDKLIVAINSDSSVKSLKGNGRPIQTEDVRAEVVAALESVDFVTLFNEDTPIKLIQDLKPDFLVKGGDWKVEEIVGAHVVKENGGKVFSIPITYNCSTSDIVSKIINQTTK